MGKTFVIIFSLVITIVGVYLLWLYSPWRQNHLRLQAINDLWYIMFWCERHTLLDFLKGALI